MTAVAQALEAVLESLREQGWIQGEFANEEGHCLSAAISKTCPYALTMSVYYAVEQQIPRRFQKSSSPVVAFNDAPRTDFAKVEALIQRAIAAQT